MVSLTTPTAYSNSLTEDNFLGEKGGGGVGLGSLGLPTFDHHK